MGWMTAADMGRPGYHNDLAKNAITIAEGLKLAGYRSYMTGKWHVVAAANAGPDSKDKSNWPLQRGFDRYYGSSPAAATSRPRRTRTSLWTMKS